MTAVTTDTPTPDHSATEDAEDEQVEETDEQAKPKGERQDIPPAVAAALKKANAEAEKYRLALKKIEDRDKTELQRATDERDEAKKTAEKANTAYLRLKVGTAKGLPLNLAERLHGDTEDEMEADADDLLAAMKPAGTNGKTPSFEAGPRKPAPKGTSMNDLIRGRARR